jgi:hypothetical protein
MKLYTASGDVLDTETDAEEIKSFLHNGGLEGDPTLELEPELWGAPPQFTKAAVKSNPSVSEFRPIPRRPRVAMIEAQRGTKIQRSVSKMAELADPLLPFVQFQGGSIITDQVNGQVLSLEMLRHNILLAHNRDVRQTIVNNAAVSSGTVTHTLSALNAYSILQGQLNIPQDAFPLGGRLTFVITGVAADQLLTDGTGGTALGDGTNITFSVILEQGATAVAWRVVPYIMLNSIATAVVAVDTAAVDVVVAISGMPVGSSGVLEALGAEHKDVRALLAA